MRSHSDLRWGRLAVVAVAAVAAGASPPAVALAEPAPEPAVTNGTVEAMVAARSRVYLGGRFTYAGPKTGPAIFLDPASGTRSATFKPLVGTLTAAVPDGSGGVFVSGSLTIPGNRTRPVVHVLGDGRLDPAFDAALEGSGGALTVAGSRLYLVVNRTAQDRPITEVRALGATTGEPDPDFVAVVDVPAVPLPLVAPIAPPPPTMPCDADRRTFDFLQPTGALALAALGSRVYIGGLFDAVNGVSRTNLAAVDAQTGQLDAEFNPGLVTDGSWNGIWESVRVLAVVGPRLLAGGYGIGTAANPAASLVAFDPVSGAVDGSFTATALEKDKIVVLLPRGDRVYAGGVAGTGAGRLSALDVDSGAIDLTFAATLAGDVASLAVAGDRLLVGTNQQGRLSAGALSTLDAAR